MNKRIRQLKKKNRYLEKLLGLYERKFEENGIHLPQLPPSDMSEVPPVLPCPACGDASPEYGGNREGTVLWVACGRRRKCGMTGPLAYSYTDAVKAWNALPRHTGDDHEQIFPRSAPHPAGRDQQA